jgi:cell wall-associated NlpC family hydrolase
MIFPYICIIKFFRDEKSSFIVPEELCGALLVHCIYLRYQPKNPNMTKKHLGRSWILVWTIVAAFLIGAINPSASEAKASRKNGKSVKKASHSVQKKQRRAKLSLRHRRPVSSTLTASEKTEIIERINSIATTEVVEEFTSSADNTDVMLPDDIARAAKEEEAEDDVDVSIDRFFATRFTTGEDMTLDPNALRDRQMDYTLFDELDPSISASRSDIMQHIVDWLGTRYHFGGLNRDGIDCSAFVREIYRNSFNVELPRTASMQSALGERIKKDELRFGDLVFFHTAGHAHVSHVGIYIGEGLFANASCSKGVTVSAMDSKYWSRRYLFAKRLFTNTSTASREINNYMKLASQTGDLETANTN